MLYSSQDLSMFVTKSSRTVNAWLYVAEQPYEYEPFKMYWALLNTTMNLSYVSAAASWHRNLRLLHFTYNQRAHSWWCHWLDDCRQGSQSNYTLRNFVVLCLMCTKVLYLWLSWSVKTCKVDTLLFHYSLKVDKILV